MVSDSVTGGAYTATSFPRRAQELVFDLAKDLLEPSDHHVNFDLEDVYVVSFSYVLNNWKALVSTTLPDGMYYEVTHNSLKKETYVTSYKQWAHRIIPEKPEERY